MDGIILYPAAGMLVMAIEGIRSLPTSVRRVAGYKFRDVNIGSALAIPQGDEGVEVQLHMGPCNPTSDAHKGIISWTFWIQSVANGEWKLHCSGQISVEEDALDDAVSTTQDSDFRDAHKDLPCFKSVHERCSTSLESSDLYQAVLEKSVELGPTFRKLHNIRFNQDDREATATLSFGTWTQKVKQLELSEHLIHPTTLDGLFHIPFASVFPQLPGLPPVVPRQISEIFISNYLLSDKANNTLRLYGNTTELGKFGLKANVTAVGTSVEKPLVYLRDIHLQGFHVTKKRAPTASTSLFHRFEWKPDISLLSRCDIENYCREHATKSGLPSGGFDAATELVCRYFLSEMLRQVGTDYSPESYYSSKPSIQKYIQWAKAFLLEESKSTSCLLKSFPEFEGQHTRAAVIEKYATRSPQKRQTVEYGQKLVEIVKGKVDALALLFNDGLAESLYSSPSFALTAHRLAGYIDLLAHKNSDLNVLEVGAGTGSTTTPVLEVLALPSIQAPRYKHYHFTDISPSFFADAQVRYAAHSSRMSFKVLDIEHDPEEQGFKPGSYDVVIAAAV